MTGIPFGQRNNPAWDALRVHSLDRLGGLLSDNQAPAVINGLNNRIYVWQFDGTPILDFDPDAIGLGTAIGVARDGGAITIPSMTIALTASITLPIGVTLIGLSREGSRLSFTGLSGASAVIHTARSTLEHLTVIVAGTQPLVGVDARAAKARVRHVAVYMESDANNVKIYAGYAEA